MRLMIIEDDEIISGGLKLALEKWQFEVKTVEDFQTISAQVETYQPHLILLDINLPYYNGYHWCQEIRKTSQVPIIFISSLSDHMDMIRAMDLGGDDFITKPLDMALVLSKVQALLRRSYEFTGLQDPWQKLSYHGLSLDPGKALMQTREVSIDLTHTEVQILTRLFQETETFVSREDLLDYCWMNDQYIDDNTLAVNMTRIRKKLRTYALDTWIQTKKKVGYRLQEPEEDKR